MNNTTLLTELSQTNQAIENCKRTNNTEWQKKHTAKLAKLLQLLPSGAGIDSGTKLVSITASKAVFLLKYHHMNETGCYTHWTEHKVIFTASFTGVGIAVTGRNDNDIKDYLTDTFLHYLTQPVPDHLL